MPSLPTDAAERRELHDEVHARPPARIRLPALITYVAVLNAGIAREQELAHLRRLPGQAALQLADLERNFVRLQMGGRADALTLKWERHNEFTRYALVQTLPDGAGLDAATPPMPAALPAALPAEWLATLPGRTIAAVQLAMVEDADDDADRAAQLARAERWFGPAPLVASIIGNSAHSLAVTDFALGADGFTRMLVISDRHGTDLRAGRIAQRLLELETYRLMALRGLPVAKALAPALADAEQGLARVTADLASGAGGAAAQLDALIALAATVEHATARHGYRFAATTAYHAIVEQRIAELRERSLPGMQTLGGFMQRRLSPAIATVASTERRLEALAARIERSGALLRTRVDIAAEAQQQQLLRELTKGQALQLSLQTTVEGLSIAAISYYVVSLLGYAGKAAKTLGAPIDVELAVGCLIPAVLWAVWRGTQRIHRRLHAERGA